MGLTNKSLEISTINDDLQINKDNNEVIISLAGNPNVGKSSIFNILTGMNQHTGNWPGKTVGNTIGSYNYKDKKFTLVDIPGTYSLMANSKEEEIARDFICFSNSDLTLVVIDATNLKRNLNLLLQILEVTNNVILCVNLIDEANKKKISIDFDKLENILGIKVIATSAKKKIGIDNLKEKIYNFNKTNKTYKINYNNTIEESINMIKEYIDNNFDFKIDSRFLAIKLLEKEDNLFNSLEKYLKYDFKSDIELNSVIDRSRANLEDKGIKLYLLRDIIVSEIINNANNIYDNTVKSKYNLNKNRDRFIDKLLTSKLTGIPIMIIMLMFIFWLTIVGSNYPSELLTKLFQFISDKLYLLFEQIKIPNIITDFLLSGIYKTVTWIISVMLPPMAIFFPLFTLLEDLGVLPRIAFNMDNIFRKCGSHGKQSLTMCMGFGCNACGVVGSRIIESNKDRMLSIMTNNFVPCNGRFPTLISIITMFLITSFRNSNISAIISTLILTFIILLGIGITLLVTKILSCTMYKDEESHFILELPPYRKPQICSIIVRSIFDRTLFVLSRAIKVAIPAGIIIWLMSNIMIGENNILYYLTNFLDPFGRFFGLDGTIVMAFILGFPANEIVIPIIIMSYMNSNMLMDISNLSTLKNLFIDNGWTITTAICMMLFCLFHYPCGTTLLTIKKESNSNLVTFLSFVIPTVIGLIMCLIARIIINIII